MIAYAEWLTCSGVGLILDRRSRSTKAPLQTNQLSKDHGNIGGQMQSFGLMSAAVILLERYLFSSNGLRFICQFMRPYVANVRHHSWAYLEQ